MKILLINPQPKKKINILLSPPIGLGYLAASLLKAGHEVKILDCVKDKVPPEALNKYLIADQYDLIGLTVYTPTFNAIKEYSCQIKTISPKSVTIVGGPHVTLLPRETLETLDKINYAFCGEAERGLCQLAEMIQKEGNPLKEASLFTVENLVWRNKEGSIQINPQSFIDDLDEIPSPAWELLKPDTYQTRPLGIFTHSNRVASIATSRGCPHACTFCSVKKVTGSKTRIRSAIKVVEEIQFLKDHFHIQEFAIIDDNFTQDLSRLQEICRLIISKKLNILWSCPNGIRIESLDIPTLKLMEKSGCYSLGIGIEFGTQHMLNAVKKGVRRELIEEKIALIKNHTQIRLTGFFILGHPKESLEDIQKTVEFACTLPIDRALFSNYYPFPGSEDYEDLISNHNYPINKNYDSFYVDNMLFFSKQLPHKRLVKLRNGAYWKFYSRPKILFNLAKEIKSLSQLKALFARISRLLYTHEKF